MASVDKKINYTPLKKGVQETISTREKCRGQFKLLRTSNLVIHAGRLILLAA
jgi:hypothetical protein